MRLVAEPQVRRHVDDDVTSELVATDVTDQPDSGRIHRLSSCRALAVRLLDGDRPLQNVKPFPSKGNFEPVPQDGPQNTTAHVPGPVAAHQDHDLPHIPHAAQLSLEGYSPRQPVPLGERQRIVLRMQLLRQQVAPDESIHAFGAGE